MNWLVYTPIAKGYFTLGEYKSGLISLYDLLDSNEAIETIRIEEKRQHELNNPKS